MAKTKKSKINLKSLYSFKYNDKGQKVFDKKPSSFTKEELQKMVKTINDRLYKLEKAGLEEDSKLYRNLKKYSETQSGENGIFNVKDDKVRISSNLNRFGETNAEKYQNIKFIQGYLSSETSTVGGTNRAFKKAFKSFKENPKFLKYENTKNMTLKDYKNLWKIYRNNVSEDAKDKLGSDVVVNAVKSDLYELSDDKILKALKYANDVEVLGNSYKDKVNANNKLVEKWYEEGFISEL